MSNIGICKITHASVVALALLFGSVTGHAQCTYPDVYSGGIWTYIARDQHFTITLVNLTDYLLYNSGNVHMILAWQGVQDPFNGRPIKVIDLDGDGKLEAGVPPYSGVTWAATNSSSYHHPYFEGELILELTGFTDDKAVNHPGPTWPNKFRVWFTPQDPDKGSDKGTWISLRPEATEWSQWDGRNLYRSGVWTTPHFPGNVSYPSGGDDLELRNIVTMSNKHVVATLYSTDHLNVVIVVRQTNWVGPAIPSDADPVAGMDAYKAWRLDWAENTSDSVPGNCNR
jgi:hypothetical protein